MCIKVSFFKCYISWYTYLPLRFNRHADTEYKASCSMTLMRRLKLLPLKCDRKIFTKTKKLKYRQEKIFHQSEHHN